MKSGWIVFSLVVLGVALSACATMSLVSDYGMGSEFNPYHRFLYDRLGTLAFPLGFAVAVLFVFFSTRLLLRSGGRISASCFLVIVALYSFTDAGIDYYALLTHGCAFPIPIFLALTLTYVVVSVYLFDRGVVPPLEF